MAETTRTSRRTFYSSNKRRFFMLEKTPLTEALIAQVKRVYTGSDDPDSMTDAEAMRRALSDAARHTPPLKT